MRFSSSVAVNARSGFHLAEGSLESFAGICGSPRQGDRSRRHGATCGFYNRTRHCNCISLARDARSCARRPGQRRETAARLSFSNIDETPTWANMVRGFHEHGDRRRDRIARREIMAAGSGRVSIAGQGYQRSGRRTDLKIIWFMQACAEREYVTWFGVQNSGVLARKRPCKGLF